MWLCHNIRRIWFRVVSHRGRWRSLQHLGEGPLEVLLMYRQGPALFCYSQSGDSFLKLPQGRVVEGGLDLES
jgi:hypothetical protein